MVGLGLGHFAIGRTNSVIRSRARGRARGRGRALWCAIVDDNRVARLGYRSVNWS